MQIHEITQLKEGVLDTVKSVAGDVGRGIVKGITGFEMEPSQSTIDRDAANAAAGLRTKGYTPTASTRISVSLTQPGQSVPSKYYKTGDVWTNELGNKITDVAQTLYLDKLIPTHGRTETIPPVAQSARKTVSRRRTK